MKTFKDLEFENNIKDEKTIKTYKEMRKEKITSRKHKDDYYHFYFNGKDITNLWMDFFSSLSMEDESRCEELFLKKYRTKLLKLKT